MVLFSFSLHITLIIRLIKTSLLKNEGKLFYVADGSFTITGKGYAANIQNEFLAQHVLYMF